MTRVVDLQLGKDEFEKFLASPVCSFAVKEMIKEFFAYTKENKWQEALKSYNFISGYLWGLDSVDMIDCSVISHISDYLLSLL